MSDYRLKITVRNARILKAIEAAGYTSLAEFCRVEGISYQGCMKLISMQSPAIGKNGSFLHVATQLMESLCALPQDLWSPEQLNAHLPHSTWTQDVSSDEIQKQLNNISAERLVKKLMDKSNINRREKQVLIDRSSYDEKTLSEVGDERNITGNRVRQIEEKALRSMRTAASRLGVSADELDDF